MTLSSSRRCWAVLPAAGIGSRFGASIPKQYVFLNGRAVASWSLARFLAEPMIAGIMVALHTQDRWFAGLPEAQDARVHTTLGGAERGDSVLAALQALQPMANADDWVLVHDIARPCLSAELLSRLLTTLRDDPVGGLLALPCADTLKQSLDQRHSVRTLDRREIWAAQTPQMFPFGRLQQALQGALAAGVNVTDEASALEWLGDQPRLIESSSHNIKLTRPEDSWVAEAILAAQHSE